MTILKFTVGFCPLANAIDFLYDAIKNKRPMSERLIKDINAMLPLGIKYTIAINEFGNKIKKPAHPDKIQDRPESCNNPKRGDPLLRDMYQAILDYIEEKSRKLNRCDILTPKGDEFLELGDSAYLLFFVVPNKLWFPLQRC